MDAESKHSFPITDWKNKGIRVGWHIRNSKGQIGIVTWIGDNGGLMYKLIESEAKQ